MGLLVDEIVDIVEDVLDIEIAAIHDGAIGSAVVAGRATEILDTTAYLTRAFADWFGSPDTTAGDNGVRRVLLVDDSSFFRELMRPLLATAGYQVTTADDADAALRMREDGADFDVIVSDIEMPGMNGFEFVQAVREDARWKDTPMVALSSHTSSSDIGRGRDAGFVDYVAKMDRQALLHSLSQTLDTTATGDPA
jgi:two-component system chemotaxis sensor kinase CheA